MAITPKGNTLSTQHLALLCLLPPRAAAGLPPVSVGLPALGFHMKGTTEFMSPELIHMIAGISNPFLFMAELYATLTIFFFKVHGFFDNPG